MLTERAEFLGIRFDPLSMEQVVDRLAGTTDKTAFRYVVTPNVDHVVRLHEDSDDGQSMKALYEGAELCLCDSKILRLLAWLRGVALPVVTGSDLTARTFDRLVRHNDRIAIVGGDRELLGLLQSRFAGVEFVQIVPPMGLRRDSVARRKAAEFIAKSRARFTFIAVGSPQQEMIAAEAKSMAGAVGTGLCIGAGLEFLTGREQRAPIAAQRLGLEWAHRLITDPARLWRRYLLEGPRVFALAFRWQSEAARRSHR
jgi:N-acetylglucosaminyldiphosphoundecaprenol N-acetyl-beta-D-mannosaminyltransferase